MRARRINTEAIRDEARKLGEDALIATTTKAMAERDAAWMIQNGTGRKNLGLAGYEEKARIYGDELRRRYSS